MNGSKILKAIGFIVITAIFGFLGFYLKSSVDSGLLFLENNDSLLAESIVIFAPLVICIILGWIRHKKIWIGSLLTILACTAINAVLGENTTPRHVPLFIACLIIPYILCLIALFSGGDGYRSSRRSSSSSRSSTSSSSSSSSSSGYSGYSDPSPGLNTHMTIRGTNKSVYYKNGGYVDGSGAPVSITEIEE